MKFSIKSFFKKYRKKYNDSSTFNDGSVYHGEFSYGKIKGNGIYITSNNQEYHGKFYDLKKFTGHTIDPFGNKLEGHFTNLFLENGTITNIDSSILEGIFDFNLKSFKGNFYTKKQDINEVFTGTFNFAIQDNKYVLEPIKISSYTKKNDLQNTNSIFKGTCIEINYKESPLINDSIKSIVLDNFFTEINHKNDGYIYDKVIVELSDIIHNNATAKVWGYRRTHTVFGSRKSFLTDGEQIYTHLMINENDKNKYTFDIIKNDDLIFAFKGKFEYYSQKKLSCTFQGDYYKTDFIGLFDGVFTDKNNTYTVVGLINSNLNCIGSSVTYSDKNVSIEIVFESRKSHKVTKLIFGKEEIINEYFIKSINEKELKLRSILKSIIHNQSTDIQELTIIKQHISNELLRLPEDILKVKTKKYQGYEFNYYSCFSYFSKSKYEHLIFQNSRINFFREQLYSFKDGKIHCLNIMIAEFIKQVLEIDHDNKNFIFCIIPASTTFNNQVRYKKFCNEISNYLKIVNGFEYITRIIDKEKSTKIGKGNIDPLLGITLHSNLIDQNIILFDDVITRGESMAKLKINLLKLGVKSIECFSLFNTYNGDLDQENLSYNENLCSDLFHWIHKRNNEKSVL